MPFKLRMSKAVGAISAMVISIQFDLLRLPDEMIALVVEHVDDRKTLRHLALTCHRVQDIAENKLYRTLTIRTATAAQGVERSWTARPGRAKALRILDVPCEENAFSTNEFTSISRIIEYACNLREFMFESPACNSSTFEDSARWCHMAHRLFAPFQAASLRRSMSDEPLQRLRKLTVHLNGENSPYWTLDTWNISILLTRSLEELKISCVNIIDDIASNEGPWRKKSTPLKVLILEECNITAAGLMGILSLPRALERLYLGENCHNVHHFPRHPIPPACNYLFERKPILTLEALKEQKDSLRTLTYATTTTRYHPLQFHRKVSNSSAIDGGFSNFYKLEHVTLIGDCPAFERSLMTGASPPNLKHLVCKNETPFESLFRGSDETISRIPFLRAPSASIPKSLEGLDIAYIEDHEIAALHLTKPSSQGRSFIRDVEKVTLEVGIKLRIFATDNNQRLTYYPPLLYGEPEPEEHLVFDEGFADASKPPNVRLWDLLR